MKKTLSTTIAAMLCASASWLHAQDVTLKEGDPAPKLQTGEWVQGEPVKEFEKGKTYIVEFWATWCGPCRVTIPHLNDLHKKFADKGVVVIGQDCWERDESLVKPFIKQMGSNMTYRVAMDDKSTETKGAMAVTWMQAAGQNGIPAAFVVNKEGKIAWIGHPGTLDEKLLEEIVAGTYDIQKAATERQEQQKKSEEISKIAKNLGPQINEKKWDEAEKTIEELANLLPESRKSSLDFVRLQVQLGRGQNATAVETAERLTRDIKEPMPLVQISRMLVAAPGVSDKPELVNSAYKLAVRANEAAAGTNAVVLDTLARASWLKGEKEKAVEFQQKAVTTASENSRTNYQATLDSYKSGKLPEGHN